MEKAITFATHGSYEKGYHRLYLVHVKHLEKRKNLLKNGQKSEKDLLHDAAAILDLAVAKQHQALEQVWFQKIPLVIEDNAVGEAVLNVASKQKCSVIYLGRRGSSHQSTASKLKPSFSTKGKSISILHQ